MFEVVVVVVVEIDPSVRRYAAKKNGIPHGTSWNPDSFHSANRLHSRVLSPSS